MMQNREREREKLTTFLVAVYINGDTRLFFTLAALSDYPLFQSFALGGRGKEEEHTIIVLE